MTNEMHSVLSLPPAMLVALGSGYLGYVLAFRGRDEGHQTHDVVFISLAFAAIAQVVQATLAAYAPVGLVALAAFLATSAVSVIWRRFGHTLLLNALRATKISIHDGNQTAWQSLIADDQMSLARVTVFLTDGRALSQDSSKIMKLKKGRCYLGKDWSVSLHVTDYRQSGSDTWEDLSSEAVMDGFTAATYIPADRIDFIDIVCADK